MRELRDLLNLVIIVGFVLCLLVGIELKRVERKVDKVTYALKETLDELSRIFHA